MTTALSTSCSFNSILWIKCKNERRRIHSRIEFIMLVDDDGEDQISADV